MFQRQQRSTGKGDRFTFRAGKDPHKWFKVFDKGKVNYLKLKKRQLDEE